MIRVISLFRIPLSGSISENVLQFGCGSLDIDQSRISHNEECKVLKAQSEESVEKTLIGQAGRYEDTLELKEEGRWPSNLILSHLPGCQIVGTTQTKSKQLTADNRQYRKKNNYGVFDRGSSYEKGTGAKFASASGKTEVVVWKCVEGCPTGYLRINSRQGASGTQKLNSEQNRTAFSTRAHGKRYPNLTSSLSNYGDSGGADRFFLQIKEPHMSDQIPQELLDYLYTMINPPEGNVILTTDLSTVDWSTFEDQTIHGIVAVGDPEPYREEMWRVLCPGAHVALISPEDCPTGWKGTCALENQGFEVRDSIAWVREAGSIHYISKTSVAERNAGCEALPQKRMDETRNPELPGTDRPHNRALTERGNHHVSVKPLALGRRLTQDVEKGSTILDPFAGSGSFPIAFAQEGFDSVGIEMDEEYLDIFQARANHWMNVNLKCLGTEIISDKDLKSGDSKELTSLDDLFWG